MRITPKHQELAKRSKINQLIQFLAWLTRVYVFHVVQCQVQVKVRIDNDNTKTLSEDSDIDVGIWKSDIYGSLDGLDVSIDGVGNSLFLNLVDMFAESILVLLSLLQLWELNAPAWTPIIK